jgi:hypothetical protein
MTRLDSLVQPQAGTGRHFHRHSQGTEASGEAIAVPAPTTTGPPGVSEFPTDLAR